MRPFQCIVPINETGRIAVEIILRPKNEPDMEPITFLKCLTVQVYTIFTGNQPALRYGLAGTRFPLEPDCDWLLIWGAIWLSW